MASLLSLDQRAHVNHEPLDLERFWHDNDIACADPFDVHIPQAAMGIRMSYEPAFDELGVAFDMMRLEKDDDFARGLAKAYNDRAQQIVGRRLLDEQQYDPSRRPPRLLSLGEVFGCTVTRDNWSEWLHEAAGTPQELSAVLDRVERLDLVEAVLPVDYERQSQAYAEANGHWPRYGRWMRGPVTLATSIYGVENLIMLLVDDPPLAARFRDVLQRTIIAYYRLCDQLSGVTYGDDGKPIQGGFGVADDNCALLTPEMYAFFGQPILKAVFAQFAPRPGDQRYQHSDSDMGHLLQLLAEAGINRVNFGPNVRFKDIRAAMPHAIVDGTLAPFTFMRNDAEAIAFEVRRDLDEARDSRGLCEATAGSINNGSRLSSMRVVMETIWRYGRYEAV